MKLSELYIHEATCPKCGDKNAYMPFNGRELDCPTCGAPGPEVTGGDELTLEWIRVANAAWGVNRRRDLHATPGS